MVTNQSISLSRGQESWNLLENEILRVGIQLLFNQIGSS